MPSDLWLGIGAVGTISGILLPLARMLSAHRQSINAMFSGLEETLNKRVAELTHTMAQHETDDERRFGQVRADIDISGDVIMGEVHKLELRQGEQRLEVEKAMGETRHTLYGRLDQQAVIFGERADGIDQRVRQLEVKRTR